jgi:hypothetical protein
VVPLLDARVGDVVRGGVRCHAVGSAWPLVPSRESPAHKRKHPLLHTDGIAAIVVAVVIVAFAATAKAAAAAVFVVAAAIDRWAWAVRYQMRSPYTMISTDYTMPVDIR